MVNSKKKLHTHGIRKALYTHVIISGQFPDIDTRAIEKMVLENHAKKKELCMKTPIILGEGRIFVLTMMRI